VNFCGSIFITQKGTECGGLRKIKYNFKSITQNKDRQADIQREQVTRE
jgi:hypothetical protein